MRLCLLACAAAAALLALAVPPAAAEKPTIESLCLLHGVGGEADIAKVKSAYVAALRAGIAEEELLPFVEDILTHKLDCAQLERVLVATTGLKRQGLPYFVVFSKVREGLAKDAPPALVVDAAETKARTLLAARDVLASLRARGYGIRDYQNAAVIISSYLEKGYSPDELVSQIRTKGVARSGFAALSGVLKNPPQRKDR